MQDLTFKSGKSENYKDAGNFLQRAVSHQCLHKVTQAPFGFEEKQTDFKRNLLKQIYDLQSQ